MKFDLFSIDSRARGIRLTIRQFRSFLLFMCQFDSTVVLSLLTMRRRQTADTQMITCSVGHMM